MLDVFAVKGNLSHDLRHGKVRREQNESELCDITEQFRKLSCLALTRTDWRCMCVSVCAADKVG